MTAPIDNRSTRQHRIKNHLVRRARAINAIRQFFLKNDYLEVETPVRIPAPAPEAHIDAIPSNGWYLQTSPEMCMKQMLAAGYPRIYQICRCFRQNERGDRHLPEMTLLEWYTAGVDYNHMMAQTEALVIHVAKLMNCYPLLSYQGTTIDVRPPWPRLTVADAFDRFGGADVETAIKTNQFDEIMGIKIEPCLGYKKPLILYDYPASQGALARLKTGTHPVAERFELYMAGLELCNAFSELTDASEQLHRFKNEMKHRKKAGKSTYPLPEIFLDALNGMPDASGNALGLDRLMMLVTDTHRIDDVVAFVPEEL